MSTDANDRLGRQLVFVIAPPHAGGDPLAQALGSHPALLALPGAGFLLHPLFAFKESGIATAYDAGTALEATEAFLRHVPGGRATYREALRDLALRLYASALAAAGRTRYVDATPRLYYVAVELHRLFPEARFILVRRDPLAVLAATLGAAAPADAAAVVAEPATRRDLLDGPLYVQQAAELLGSAVLSLRYEDLIEAPAATWSAIAGYLGLPELAAGPGLPKTATDDDRPLITPAALPLARDYLDALDGELLTAMGYPREVLRRRLDARLIELCSGDREVALAFLRDGGAAVFAGLDAADPAFAAQLGVAFAEACSSDATLAATINPAIRRRLALDFCARSDACLDRGDVDTAIGELQRASALAADLARPWNDLGVIHWQAGERESAIELLRCGRAAQPEDWTCTENLVAMYLATERPREAREVLTHYLALKPDDDTAFAQFLALPPTA